MKAERPALLSSQDKPGMLADELASVMTGTPQNMSFTVAKSSAQPVARRDENLN